MISFKQFKKSNILFEAEADVTATPVPPEWVNELVEKLTKEVDKTFKMLKNNIYTAAEPKRPGFWSGVRNFWHNIVHGDPRVSPSHPYYNKELADQYAKEKAEKEAAEEARNTLPRTGTTIESVRPSVRLICDWNKIIDKCEARLSQLNEEAFTYQHIIQTLDNERNDLIARLGAIAKNFIAEKIKTSPSSPPVTAKPVIAKPVTAKPVVAEPENRDVTSTIAGAEPKTAAPMPDEEDSASLAAGDETETIPAVEPGAPPLPEHPAGLMAKPMPTDRLSHEDASGHPQFAHYNRKRILRGHFRKEMYDIWDNAKDEHGQWNVKAAREAIRHHLNLLDVKELKELSDLYGWHPPGVKFEGKRGKNKVGLVSNNLYYFAHEADSSEQTNLTHSMRSVLPELHNLWKAPPHQTNPIDGLYSGNGYELSQQNRNNLPEKVKKGMHPKAIAGLAAHRAAKAAGTIQPGATAPEQPTGVTPPATTAPAKPPITAAKNTLIDKVKNFDWKKYLDVKKKDHNFVKDNELDDLGLFAATSRQLNNFFNQETKGLNDVDLKKWLADHKININDLDDPNFSTIKTVNPDIAKVKSDIDSGAKPPKSGPVAPPLPAEVKPEVQPSNDLDNDTREGISSYMMNLGKGWEKPSIYHFINWASQDEARKAKLLTINAISDKAQKDAQYEEFFKEFDKTRAEEAEKKKSNTSSVGGPNPSVKGGQDLSKLKPWGLAIKKDLLPEDTEEIEKTILASKIPLSQNTMADWINTLGEKAAEKGYLPEDIAKIWHHVASLFKSQPMPHVIDSFLNNEDKHKPIINKTFADKKTGEDEVGDSPIAPPLPGKKAVVPPVAIKEPVKPLPEKKPTAVEIVAQDKETPSDNSEKSLITRLKHLKEPDGSPSFTDETIKKALETLKRDSGEDYSGFIKHALTSSDDVLGREFKGYVPQDAAPEVQKSTPIDEKLLNKMRNIQDDSGNSIYDDEKINKIIDSKKNDPDWLAKLKGLGFADFKKEIAQAAKEADGELSAKPETPVMPSAAQTTKPSLADRLKKPKLADNTPEGLKTFVEKYPKEYNDLKKSLSDHFSHTSKTPGNYGDQILQRLAKKFGNNMPEPHEIAKFVEYLKANPETTEFEVNMGLEHDPNYFKYILNKANAQEAETKAAESLPKPKTEDEKAADNVKAVRAANDIKENLPATGKLANGKDAGTWEYILEKMKYDVDGNKRIVPSMHGLNISGDEAANKFLLQWSRMAHGELDHDQVRDVMRALETTDDWEQIWSDMADPNRWRHRIDNLEKSGKIISPEEMTAANKAADKAHSNLDESPLNALLGIFDENNTETKTKKGLASAIHELKTKKYISKTAAIRAHNMISKLHDDEKVDKDILMNMWNYLSSIIDEKEKRTDDGDVENTKRKSVEDEENRESIASIPTLAERILEFRNRLRLARGVEPLTIETVERKEHKEPSLQDRVEHYKMLLRRA